MSNISLLESILEDIKEKRADSDAKKPEELDLKEMIELQAELKLALGILKEIQSELQGSFDKLRYSIVPHELDKCGIDKITYEGIGRVSLTDGVRASFVPDSRKEAHEWLNDNGLGDLVSQTVHAQVLSALARTKIKEGKPLPDKLFKVTTFTRASITKTTTKE